MQITPLPARPSLENLKKQAKRLHKSAQGADPQALRQVGPYFGDPRAITLTQAQLVIARGHGFSSWTRLKRHIEGGGHDSDPHVTRFLDLVALAYNETGDRGPHRFEEAAKLLAQHPEIADHSIHTAAALGDAAAVTRWLDENPALLEARDGPFQWTPLMTAAYARFPGRSSWPAGRVLIDRGADPNTFYMWGGQYRFTALTGVFGEGEAGPRAQPAHPDCEAFARALLDAGAHPNDSQALYNRCFEPGNLCLELLLEYGLRPTDVNNWHGGTPDAPQDNTDRVLDWQMTQAIRRGYVDRARLLLDHGCDPNGVDDTYDTRIKGLSHYDGARLMGQLEIAALLKAAGAEDRPLPEPLAFEAACAAGDTDTAARLLSENPALGQGDSIGTLIFDVVGSGNIPAVQTLDALGISLQIDRGNTPLHVAAFRGDLPMVQLLVALGHDTTIRDSMHQSTPLGHAIFAGKDEVVEYLSAQPMDFFSLISLGLVDRMAEALDADPALLEQPFSAVARGPVPYGWITPLVAAVRNGQPGAVALLLDRGANPHVPDGDGTPYSDILATEASSEVMAIFRDHSSG